MAFPTTSLLDDFNRANSGGLGPNWNELGPSFQILSNTLRDNGFAYWQPGGVALFVQGGEIYVTISGTNLHYLEFRQALASNRTLAPTGTGNWSGYFAEFSITGDTVKLFKYNGASVTQIGSTISTAVGSGDQIGASFNGSTIKLYVNGTQVGSDFTDSSYLDAGVLTLEGGSGAIFDDFGGGSLTAPASFLAPQQFTARHPLVR